MKALFVTLTLLGVVASQDPKSLLGLCANPPKTPPKPLSMAINLPDSYKISGSITDWTKSETALLEETVTNNYTVLQRQKRRQEAERWVHDKHTGLTKFINVTTGECNGDKDKNEVRLIDVPRFTAVIGDDTSTMYNIIQGLMRFTDTQQGFDVDSNEVVGGISSTKWVSCVDNPKSDETKVLIEVRYASDGTISPAQQAFRNPLILSIRLAELDSFNSTSARNHISIEYDRYELPTETEFPVEHGIFCTNLSTIGLPLKPLDEYAAYLNYFDHTTNRSELVEILYSKSRQLFIVAGNTFEKGVRILGTDLNVYNGSDYILHDFKYGYEFLMTRNTCKKFTALAATTADTTSPNNTVDMKRMEEFLVNTKLEWASYLNDVDMAGVRFNTFRAFNSKDGTVNELHLTDDGEVHSLSTFRKGTRELVLTMAVTRIPLESSRLNLGRDNVQLSDCYDNGNFSNNTWIVPIKDKKMSDIRKVGLHRLNDAVATSINNIYPIIPYRVVVFWVENKNGGLSMTLRLAEKTDVQPALVGYNFTAELSTLEVFQLMNASMIADKMPIEVEVNGVKEEWKVDASAMRTFPPDSDTGFLGYTGGAMFVLAVFCLLIGVSIGAVGVFVATRRQRISTLAYQVFE